MTMTYVMHRTTGFVGVADLPDWLNFDEKPARSFEVRWLNLPAPTISIQYTTTEHSIPITKEVADIVRGV